LLSPLAMRTFVKYCGMEQLVARRAHNPKVVGSSPAPATKKGCYCILFFYFGILKSLFRNDC